MLKRLIAIAGVLAMAGCATAPDPIADDVASEMRASDVAVAFSYPEKRITYTELVYKVLWNEYRTTTANFSGMWDIESDLAAAYSRELRKGGYPTEPFGEIVSDSVYEGFVGNAAAYDPLAEDESNKKFTPSRQTRDALVDKGFSYLVVVRGINLGVYDQVGTNPQIGMGNYLTIHNLRSGDVDYRAMLRLYAKPELDGSARQLEENGLAAYREHLTQAVRELFESEDIQQVLGSARQSS